jgi:hypothetical protein
MERRISINSSLGLCDRRCLRACRLSPAEGAESRPDMLHSLLVEGLDRGIPALRGIDFHFHLAAVRIDGSADTAPTFPVQWASVFLPLIFLGTASG